MTRKIDWTLLALATGMIVAVSGVMTARDAGAAPVAASPEQVAEATVSTQHESMTTVRQGGISYRVHQDAATGRLQLCTPTGKQRFLR